MPRFRPRISILNAMLLMTIVVMAIVIGRFWREVERRRAEERQLRDEIGALSIDDHSQPAAIELLSLDRTTWRYRIYVPKGQQVGVVLTVNDVPPDGLPSIRRPPPPADTSARAWTYHLLPKGQYLFLGEGEYVITVGVARNEDGNRCVGMDLLYASMDPHRQDFHRTWGAIDVDAARWPRVDVGGFGEGVGRSTKSLGGRKALVLNRYRVPNRNESLDQPMDGFLLWLEPVANVRADKTSPVATQ